MFQDVKTAHGAVGNGVADDRPAFVAADGAGGTIYVPRGTYRIGSSLTLASDVRFEQGAKLKPDSGVTVTLNGGLDAGVFQVFDVTAGGKVEPNRVEQMIPQWWGALATGAVDDYPAIAAALDAARKSGQYGAGGEGAIIFFPPGVYRVDTPLNCTNGQFHLRGSGSFQTVLRGNTGAGKSIIEATGARYCTFEGLLLDTVDMPGKSTVGILFMRNTGLFQAGDHHVRDVRVQLHTDGNANGGNGTVGIYLCSQEVVNFHGCTGGADTGLLITSANLFGLVGTHVAVQTAAESMTVVFATGNCWFYGYRGPAVRIHSAACIHIDALLTSLYYEVGLASGHDYAIDFTASASDVSYRGSMEGFPQLVRITLTTVYGLVIDAYAGRVADKGQIWLDGGVIDSGRISIVPTQQTRAIENHLIDSPSNRYCVVSGCDISLRNQKIRLLNADSLITSCTIRSDKDLSAGVIQATTKRGVLLVAADKVEADGVVLDGTLANGVRLDAGKVGVGNAAAASTIAAPGTVVKKIEVFDAAGASLGFVPVYASIT